jgi:hypothetical protein
MHIAMNPIDTTVPVQAVLSITDNGTSVAPVSNAWSTSDPNIATVDANSGVVTPTPGQIKPASCIITANFVILGADGTTQIPGTATGTVNVTIVGDNVVATVDFQPIAAPVAAAA